ncbi:universal stress protein (plasmid) [Halarchaeum sp. CBA1220]|uniref:universal stress protein n=1 Tax=Halarchaeum sp. CBA1220 TaxID=1853682 RepID=UPI000F3AA13C|nr:universal stress protein [Halarchaeum sp. CBA1220]QLC34821.1 universal stress protein [Halarchaeum sp. CBA1220]
MHRGLVVVEESEAHANLLREAAEHARGADAPLTILTFATERHLSSDAEKFEALGGIEGVTYDNEAEFIDAAEDALGDYVADALDGLDVEYEVAVRVIDGGYGTATLSAADDYDCDHIFVTGRRRSPAGKAIFGDWIQRVLLDFDGYVTVHTESEE